MDQSKKSSISDESSASSASWEHNLRPEKMVEVKTEPVSSRKIQKAEREKIRRDKLNEQFLELGYALDPNRPRSDKASILIDTIQILKHVMTQVDRLKAEYVTLSQESLQLIQEKSKLREEKSSLKTDIEILNAQYKHRVRTMVPWIPQYAAVFTLPFPLNGTQNHAPLPNPCSTSSAASLSPKTEQKDDVGLELELKIHGSSLAQQDVTTTSGSSNSYPSSEAVQDSSPDNVKNIFKS